MSQYEAVFTCGYCGKKTPMTDEQVEKTHQMDVLEPMSGICPCGHHSYSSSFSAKYPVDFSAWWFSFRSSK